MTNIITKLAARTCVTSVIRSSELRLPQLCFSCAEQWEANATQS
jgi:hypothetical protein